MEQQNTENKKSLEKFKAPNKEMLKYYADLYERNQSKWIRRSSLEPEHIGSIFEFEGKKMTLVGSLDSVIMLVKDQNENYYRMNCNLISEIVTGKR